MSRAPPNLAIGAPAVLDSDYTIALYSMFRFLRPAAPCASPSVPRTPLARPRHAKSLPEARPGIRGAAEAAPLARPSEATHPAPIPLRRRARQRPPLQQSERPRKTPTAQRPRAEDLGADSAQLCPKPVGARAGPSAGRHEGGS